MPRKRKRSQPHRKRRGRRSYGFGANALHIKDHIAAMKAAVNRVEANIADAGLDPAERYRQAEAATLVCVDAWLRLGELSRLRPKLRDEGALQLGGAMAMHLFKQLDEMKEAARVA